MSWTKQCVTCGHHEHLPDICIVGTDADFVSPTGRRQVLCSCDGKSRNDC